MSAVQSGLEHYSVHPLRADDTLINALVKNCASKTSHQTVLASPSIRAWRVATRHLLCGNRCAASPLCSGVFKSGRFFGSFYKKRTKKNTNPLKNYHFSPKNHHFNKNTPYLPKGISHLPSGNPYLPNHVWL
jgi:hypothetical protein